MGILVSTYESVRPRGASGVQEPDTPPRPSMLTAIRKRLARVRLVSLCAPLPRRPRYNLLLPGTGPRGRA